MIAAIPGTDTLEEAGFAIEGVTQTLQAMSTSEACRHMAGALDLLAKAAGAALEVVKTYVEATYEAKRQAP